MESDKEMFKFFIEFVLFDHSETGVDVKVDVLRKNIINRFHDTISPSRILTTLSLIGDIILKLHLNIWKKYKMICMMFVKTLCICYPSKILLIKI